MKALFYRQLEKMYKDLMAIPFYLMKQFFKFKIFLFSLIYELNELFFTCVNQKSIVSNTVFAIFSNRKNKNLV